MLQAITEEVSIFFRENAANFIPVLRLRPSYHKNMVAYKECCNRINTFNLEKVNEHKMQLEKEGFADEPRDFIEGYLQVGTLNATPKGQQ